MNQVSRMKIIKRTSVLEIFLFSAFLMGCSEMKFSPANPGFAAKGVVSTSLNPACVPDYQPCIPGGNPVSDDTTALKRAGPGSIGFTSIKVKALGCAAPGSDTTLMTLQAMRQNCEPYQYSRCSNIPYDPAAAQRLLAWVAKCSESSPALKTFWRITHTGADLAATAGHRQLYPVLKSHTDSDWRPPTDETASCEVPGGIEPIDTICSPGCSTPEQRLLTSAAGDSMAIGDAITSSNKAIAVVKGDGSLSNIQIVDGEVEYFISSQNDETQDLVIIKTGSGKTLRLTTGHPLVGADGEIHLADTVAVGDDLLRADGGSDRVVEVSRDVFFGKVHNVAPKLDGTSGSGELIISEGLVQGSHRHQLDSSLLAGRKLFRERLTQGLIE